MKTAILRAVSHDFRSPLTAILASASALMHTGLSLDEGDRQELVGTIIGEAERLDRVVGNLLDLSRLHAGAAQPAPTRQPIADILLQTLDAMDGATAGLDVSLGDEASALVRVDVHQIERVLANTIENALRFSPPGEPVHVRVHGTSSEVMVRVIDHGPGIAASELERIFEPFYRGSRNENDRDGGLGLAIARGFAEANGGRLWAESREGQGSAFVLALPR
jgi:two-component system sensor histidine kinase KdpD